MTSVLAVRYMHGYSTDHALCYSFQCTCTIFHPSYSMKEKGHLPRNFSSFYFFCTSRTVSVCLRISHAMHECNGQLFCWLGLCLSLCLYLALRHFNIDFMYIFFVGASSRKLLLFAISCYA